MALQNTDSFLVQRSGSSYKMEAADFITFLDESGFGSSSVTISSTPPVGPENGDMWWNSVDGNLYIYYTDVDTSQWVPANGAGGGSGFTNASVGPNVPSNASQGDLWYSTNDARLYVYDGSVWIDASPSNPSVPDDSITTAKIADGAVTSAKTDIPGGQLVGYQQGIWRPTIGLDGGVGTPWLDNGDNPDNHMSNWSASWHRIGNSVTVNFYFTFNSGGSSATPLTVTDLPYRFRDFDQATAGAGSAYDVMMGSGLISGSNIGNYGQINTYMWKGPSSVSSTDPDGGFRFYASNSIGQAATAVALGGSSLIAGCFIGGELTYITDDTTWTPINGATLA